MSAYVVLGLIARHGPMTPYELKARVEESIAPFWPIPHAQLYRDPPRLAELGLLTEETEEGGRRRRFFHLTPAGERALREWLSAPELPQAEFRDPAQVRLAFADLGDPADLVRLARTQARQHRELMKTYEQRRAALDPGDAGTVSRERMLSYGILHEQAHAAFWETIAAADEDPDDPSGPTPKDRWQHN
ncbi:PadR family transcriptional regulator [Actinoallomurus sp. NPDC052308]|uniref:PadR family transcriptional regulator n=1 Tax=Actinoallomurus sp. NPDC052308 TaxID=3155530 RepID=UPI003442BE5C